MRASRALRSPRSCGPCPLDEDKEEEQKDEDEKAKNKNTQNQKGRMRRRRVRTPGNTTNLAGMVVSEPTDIVERSKEILGLRSRRVGKRLAILMVFKAKHGRAAGISHRTPSKHERTLSTGAPIDGQPPTNLMKFIGLGEGCRSIGSPVDWMRSYSKVVVHRTLLQKHRSGRKSTISTRIWT